MLCPLPCLWALCQTRVLGRRPSQAVSAYFRRLASVLLCTRPKSIGDPNLLISGHKCSRESEQGGLGETVGFPGGPHSTWRCCLGWKHVCVPSHRGVPSANCSHQTMWTGRQVLGPIGDENQRNLRMAFRAARRTGLSAKTADLSYIWWQHTCPLLLAIEPSCHCLLVVCLAKELTGTYVCSSNPRAQRAGGKHSRRQRSDYFHAWSQEVSQARNNSTSPRGT